MPVARISHARLHAWQTRAHAGTDLVDATAGPAAGEAAHALLEITGLDHGNGRGHRTVARFRRELITVPARLIRAGGAITIRPPPGENLLAVVLPILQRLSRLV